MVAPANLPAPIVGQLNGALVDIMAEAATREHFLKLGMQPLSSTPEALGAYIRRDRKWAPIIKTAGATEVTRAGNGKETKTGGGMRNDFTIGTGRSVRDRQGAGRRAADVSGRALHPARRRGAVATPTGYDSAWDGILPAAEHLAKQGVDAIMVIGTSLTFYRGSDFHEQLLESCAPPPACRSAP